MMSKRSQSALAAIAALFALAAPARAQDPDRAREDVEAREEWFWAQRSFPSTVRPYEQMMRARAAAFANSLTPRAAFSSAPVLLGGSWRPLGPLGLFDAGGGFFGSGPQLDAGRVAAVAPSPIGGGPLLIGTASGGVWRSLTQGTSWTPLTDAQCALTTGAVALDPVTPSIVYVGTGEFNVGSSGCGVLRSNDGGNSWTTGATGLRLSTGGTLTFGSLLVDRASAGSATSTILLGGTNGGVARSTNSGTSWTIVLTGGVSSVVASPSHAGVYWAGDRDQANAARRGLYRSADVGATWAFLPQLPVPDQTVVGRIELGVSPAAPDQVWALVNDRSNRKLLGLFRWDDVAATWTALAASGVYDGDRRGDFGAQSEYDIAIAVDPRDAKRIYVAGVRAFRSTDGGATFAPMANEIHCDWHTIVIDPRNPDILYAGTDGGVFISTDAGDTWTSRNGGLAITQYYPGIAISPTGTVMMGGSQDNGTHLFTGSPYWDGFSAGDGGYTAINYRTPTIQYGETQWSTTTGNTIFRKDPTGLRSRTNGIDVNDRAQFIPPLILDPVTPTKLYFGTYRLYRTLNEGLLWTAVSPDLSRTPTGTITTIAVAPSDTNTIYVGTNDGAVQASHDGGLTFSSIAAGIPTRAITRIVVDPAAALHVLLTVSGFQTGHVFESTDGGVTWRNITGNLVDAPANAAVFVGDPGNIFVGTDVGVFQTVDDGVTWQSGPAGLPNVIIQDLIYTPTANLLVAGTYGRGMWSYTLGGIAPVLRGDVNGDGKVDALDALAIQQALVALAPSTTSIYPRGDANCNGVIDSGDVVAVLRAAVGLTTPGSCVGTVR